MNQPGVITARTVLRYAAMPGVWPRARQLLNLGFYSIAFAMAQVFRAARLLPAFHPYLNPANYGRFGVFQVIGAAASHLVLRRENVDQIIVFFTLITAVALVFLQVVSLIMVFAFPAAKAADTPDTTPLTFTVTGKPADDVAFLLMDRIFGIPCLFNSRLNEGNSNCPSRGTASETTATPGGAGQAAIPWPFHTALHAIFKFYSNALLVVGAIILLYFVFAIVAETAETGTPFGKRFNSAWAPLRIIVAFGLLIPFGAHGLNAAQYAVLYAAKMGSGLGTNGWYVFVKEMNGGNDPADAAEADREGATAGEADATAVTGNLRMAASVHPPDMKPLVEFFAMAHFCKHTVELTASYPGQVGPNARMNVAAYLYRNPRNGDPDGLPFFLGNDFKAALKYFNGSPISIAFGAFVPEGIPGRERFKDNISPVCGILTIPGEFGGWKRDRPADNYDRDQARNPGAYDAQKIYYDLAQTLWAGKGRNTRINDLAIPLTGGSLEPAGTPAPELASVQTTAEKIDMAGIWWFAINMPADTRRICTNAGLTADSGSFCSTVWDNADGGKVGTPSDPADTFTATNIGNWITSVNNVLWRPNAHNPGAVATASGTPEGLIFDTSRLAGNEAANCFVNAEQGINYSEMGWGGAGAFYNCISNVNGQYVSAVMGMPSITSRPSTMELVRALRIETDQQVDQNDMYCPERSGDSAIGLGTAERASANLYCGLWRLWNESSQGGQGNIFVDVINYMFGTSGLYALRHNEGVHPLALLTSLGKGIIDSVIIKMGIGIAGMAGQILIPQFGDVAGVISGFMFSLAGIGLTAGFILKYVIPFMPFMYFFFALGVWAKTIFEAMVGVPLWALAHIRIDGQGLPGDAAQNGYYLILEIFLRPILIVFGLLASVTIFSAMAITLNDIFDLVTGQVSGTVAMDAAGEAAEPGLIENVRSGVDTFFFLVLYAIIIYLMAVSSFKLIDLIPQSILRWMGVSAQTFGDQAGTQVDQMTGYIAIGGSTIFPQVTQGMQSLGSGLQAGVQSLTRTTP